MKQIPFDRRTTGIGRAHDAAIIVGDEDPLETLLDAVIGSISTDVEIKLGETTIFLAMLQDPDQWEEDWRERGIEDVDEFIAGLIEERAGPSS